MNRDERHRRRTRGRDPQIIREDVLRPSRFLGYDRDAMGCYFLGREAFELAESQFCRAVWLNPFEPLFRLHWAISLIRLHRMSQAQAVLAELLRTDPGHAAARELWQRWWPQEPLPEETNGKHG